MSSCGHVAVCPGGVFVVAGGVLEAAVEDADSSAAQCPEVPGDLIADRPVCVTIHPGCRPINTSTNGVLLRPVESGQYTSTQLADTAQELGVLLSVGRTGVCWDNAQIESFWSTLKTELYNRHTFDTRTEAIHAVSSWVETVYNRRRRHSALGQIPPVAFERRTITAAEQAA